MAPPGLVALGQELTDDVSAVAVAGRLRAGVGREAVVMLRLGEVFDGVVHVASLDRQLVRAHWRASTSFSPTLVHR